MVYLLGLILTSIRANAGTLRKIRHPHKSGKKICTMLLSMGFLRVIEVMVKSQLPFVLIFLETMSGI